MFWGMLGGICGGYLGVFWRYFLWYVERFLDGKNKENRLNILTH